MAKIDYNDVFDAVTRAVRGKYALPVYGGTVENGLKTPSFNVLAVSVNHIKQMGVRARRYAVFDVVYYPSKSGAREECLEIAHELPAALVEVTTSGGDILHCTDFEPTIEDDALHCIVTYSFFVYTEDETENMETLELTTEAE